MRNGRRPDVSGPGSGCQKIGVRRQRRQRCEECAIAAWPLVGRSRHGLLHESQAQMFLTSGGAALIGDDSAGDTEQPEMDLFAGDVVAPAPGDGEGLRGHVIGIGTRGAAPAGESPDTGEAFVEERLKISLVSRQV